MPAKSILTDDTTTGEAIFDYGEDLANALGVQTPLYLQR
jgi:hypothetical protein